MAYASPQANFGQSYCVLDLSRQFFLLHNFVTWYPSKRTVNWPVHLVLADSFAIDFWQIPNDNTNQSSWAINYCGKNSSFSPCSAHVIVCCSMMSSAVLSVALVLCSVHCDCALPFPFPYTGFLPAALSLTGSPALWHLTSQSWMTFERAEDVRPMFSTRQCNAVQTLKWDKIWHSTVCM